jgi:hypothetical protein
MTKFLAGLCLMVAIGYSNEANATLDASLCINKAACAATVTVDSGTAKRCGASGLAAMRNCECGWQSGACGAGYQLVNSGTACPANYFNVGTTILGKKCCQENWSCQAQCTCVSAEDVAIAEEIKGGPKNIGAVFEPNQTTAKFFGVYNSVSRSPTGGRDNSTIAKLDVCMGDNDTTAALATNSAATCGNNYCGTSSNEYCNANTQEVCRDRCECAINGITDSTCQLL